MTFIDITCELKRNRSASAMLVDCLPGNSAPVSVWPNKRVLQGHLCSGIIGHAQHMAEHISTHPLYLLRHRSCATAYVQIFVGYDTVSPAHAQYRSQVAPVTLSNLWCTMVGTVQLLKLYSVTATTMTLYTLHSFVQWYFGPPHPAISYLTISWVRVCYAIPRIRFTSRRTDILVFIYDPTKESLQFYCFSKFTRFYPFYEISNYPL